MRPEGISFEIEWFRLRTDDFSRVRYGIIYDLWNFLSGLQAIFLVLPKNPLLMP